MPHIPRSPRVAAAVLAAVALALSACTGVAPVATPTPTTTPQSSLPTPTPSSDATPTSAPAGAPLVGVSLSPLSYEADDFQRFIAQAAELGGILRWAGPWDNLSTPGAGPDVVATLARQHGLASMIETGVFSADAKQLFRPLTPDTIADYLEGVRAFAAEHRPDYLGLGVEVNIHWEEDPDTWPLYVDLFADAYDAVKEVSPGTLVYPVFQLERMKGLQGGLFGGQNDPSAAQWDLLDAFPKADLVGFTTYPSLIFGSPAEIPADYYMDITEHTSKPVAFTEVGWPHADDIPGWESSEAEQAEFVSRLFDLTSSLDVRGHVWVWMYEQPGARETLPAFWSMTLRREDGSPRPVWDAWVNGP